MPPSSDPAMFRREVVVFASGSYSARAGLIQAVVFDVAGPAKSCKTDNVLPDL